MQNMKKWDIPEICLFTGAKRQLWLNMKFLAILLTVFCIQASAIGHAQKNVTLSITNTEVTNILSVIQKQVHYRFLYHNDSELKQIKKSISVKNAPIDIVLEQLLANTGFSYSITDQNLIIIRKGRIIHAGQQERIVSGVVTDSLNVPIEGVSVNIKGTSLGTLTNEKGLFSLEVPEGSILVFSAVGFETQEVLANTTQLKIVLTRVDNKMEDVVITAFGRATKRTEMVGSVTTVNPSDLKVPSSNLTTAFAGRIAGVVAFQRTGEPGSDNASFFVRGVTTFGSNRGPLILIDNIELTAQDLAQLQPDDIESFSIMKDAAATALYGARGANGVILVRTKKGQPGKVSTTLRLENSLSAPTRNLELADPITYMKLNNEAIVTREPLAQYLYSQEKINNTIPGSGSYIFPATDWREELLKDYAMNQRVNLSINGGGALATYYIAGAYTHDNGILKADDRNSFKNSISNDVFTLRSNITLKPISTMEITTRFNGTFTDYTGPVYTGSEMYGLIMRSNPVLFPAYYPVDEQTQFANHILFGNALASNGSSYYINPYAELVKGYRETGRSNISAQFEIKQDLNGLTEGLSARALLNVLRINSHSITRSYNPFWYTIGSYNRLEDTYSIYNLNPDDGTDYLGYSRSLGAPTANIYFEGALNYNRNFGKHQVGSMLVYQLRNNVSLGAATVQESLPYRNVGVSGRVTYGYDSRYMAEFNFGYNGSERFHKDNQFGFFPSGGVAWNISNEKWFADHAIKDVIRMLKLRATYGIVGNDNIGSSRFLYLSEINMNNTALTQSFGLLRGYSNTGISVSRYSDPTITWEKARKTNFGLEIELRNGLSLTGEYYFENRSDILLTRANIPATMGLWVTPSSNVGEAKAYGIDANLQYNRQLNSNNWLQLMGNLTFARNEYKVYDELYYDTEWWLSQVGRNINQTFGYIAERLFIDENEVKNSPTQFGVYGAGDIKFRDLNNDGQITALDIAPIGFPTVPELIYGFGASYGYKNFDISVFFQGLGRESFFINYSQTGPFFPNNSGSLVGNNQLAKFIADSYWNEDNRDIYATWPRLSTSPVSNNNRTNTWFMRDGAFIRLKSAEIGYKLSDRIIKRAGLKQARIYFSGTNLLTWSKFKLWDVEQGSSALNYPIQRVVNVGLLLSL